MVEHRHHGARIDLQIIGLQMLALWKVDMAAFPGQPFLGKDDANLDRTDRIRAVIECQHPEAPLVCDPTLAPPPERGNRRRFFGWPAGGRIS